MYSALHSRIKNGHNLKKKTQVGVYFRFPLSSQKRLFEGGLRLINSFKKTKPQKPLVSVITTAYNRELVIEKAICSVLGQSYENLEYIVIDGASTDGTLNIIKKYEDIIDYILSEQDTSLYEGMNKGLQLAKGDFIIILNSDDWYKNNCIETLVSNAVGGNLECVSALATETDGYGKVLKDFKMLPFRDNVRLRMPLRHETMLISKDLYNKVGFYDPTYKIIGDLKLTQKIFEHKSRFKQLDMSLMYFRNTGIASRLNEALVLERIRLLMEQFPYLNEKEVFLLANEFKGNTSKYVAMVKKYYERKKFVRAIKEFLSLHGVRLPTDIISE